MIIKQTAETLADFTAIDIEERAPINHVESFMRDHMMDKNNRLIIHLLTDEIRSHAKRNTHVWSKGNE